MSHQRAKLAVLMPCFNEGDGITESIRDVLGRLDALAASGKCRSDSFVLVVDDGSTDTSWQKISENAAAHPGRVRGIRLSRNFGHQFALLAGFTHLEGKADCVLSIDSDLQQDPTKIGEFLDRHAEGAEIVLGVRRDRGTDGLAKRLTALAFYRLMQGCGVPIVPNHADYRLIGSRALGALLQYREVNLFLRALVLDLGFRRAIVEFDVSPRTFGKTKYSVWKMLRLAGDGISAFTAFPLRAVSILGAAVFIGSLGMMGYVLFQKLFSDAAVPGWASTLLPIYFIGGVQLLCLGVVGEYVHRVFLEIKGRPRFLVAETTDEDAGRSA